MSSADWYAAKLRGQTPHSTYTPPPYLPLNEPSTQEPKMRAASQKLTDHCPECDSENYFKPIPASRLRCYDCGYPLVQSGSGMSTVKSEGAPRPARQVATGGFQPQTIVGRIE